MRPSRLVLISALALSALPVGSAMAQFPLPGIFRSVLGRVLPHPHFGYRHYPARGYATRTPGENPTAGNEVSATGPLFWPQLADDLFDYVLWPSGSDDHFWAHGYNDIVMGALRSDARESRESARAAAAPAQTTGSVSATPACESLKSSETADSV